MIEIVTALDMNFIKPTTVMLSSLISHTSHDLRIHILIPLEEKGDERFLKLKEKLQSSKISLIFHGLIHPFIHIRS